MGRSEVDRARGWVAGQSGDGAVRRAITVWAGNTANIQGDGPRCESAVCTFEGLRVSCTCLAFSRVRDGSL